MRCQMITMAVDSVINSELLRYQRHVEVVTNTAGVASFPPPIFDRLQYANMAGGSLGDLVTCGPSDRQMVHTWKAGPNQDSST